MSRSFSIYVSSNRKDYLFIIGVSSGIADRILQNIYFNFDIRGKKEVCERTRYKVSKRANCGDYNVYLPNRSFPFINKVSRSVAIRIQCGLEKVFRVKGAVRYWQPGTAGQFVKRW